MKKRLVLTMVGILSIGTTIFATQVPVENTNKTGTHAQHEEKRHAMLEEKATTLGITVEELQTQLEERKTHGSEKEKGMHSGDRLTLEDQAETLGITVEELQAQLEERKTHGSEKGKGMHSGDRLTLEDQAKTLGITVEELEVQREEKMSAMLEEKANALGITIEELESQMESRTDRENFKSRNTILPKQ